MFKPVVFEKVPVLLRWLLVLSAYSMFKFVVWKRKTPLRVFNSVNKEQI